MICPKCGAENKDTAKYCNLCLERFAPVGTSDPISPSDAAFWHSAPADPYEDTMGDRARRWFSGPSAPRLRTILFSLIAGIVGLVLVITVGGWALSYSVSEYSVRFRAVGSTSRSDTFDVTMRITYDVRLAPRENGFKFVGTYPVREVSVTDEAGNALPFTVNTSDYRETRIDWSYPRTWMGTRTVIVKFVTDCFIWPTDTDGGFLFRADWPQNFSVPVRNASFALVPSADARMTDARSSHGAVRVANGPYGPELVAGEAELTGAPMEFAVGRNALKDLSAQPSGPSRGSLPWLALNVAPCCWPLAFVSAWIGFIVILQRNGWLKGRGSGGSSGADGGGGGGCGGCGGGGGGCGGCGG